MSRGESKGTLRILVVEDTLSNQEVARELLSTAGHQVTIVGTGEEALEHCMHDGHGVDLIMMDLLMPTMDGPETIRHLRADSRTCHIPIVAVSAHPSAGSEALSAGADLFLAKPYRRKEVLQAIARAMEAQP